MNSSPILWGGTWWCVEQRMLRLRNDPGNRNKTLGRRSLGQGCVGRGGGTVSRSTYNAKLRRDRTEHIHT